MDEIQPNSYLWTLDVEEGREVRPHPEFHGRPEEDANEFLAKCANTLSVWKYPDEKFQVLLQFFQGEALAWAEYLIRYELHYTEYDEFIRRFKRKYARRRIATPPRRRPKSPSSTPTPQHAAYSPTLPEKRFRPEVTTVSNNRNNAHSFSPSTDRNPETQTTSERTSSKSRTTPPEEPARTPPSACSSTTPSWSASQRRHSRPLVAATPAPSDSTATTTPSETPLQKKVPSEVEAPISKTVPLPPETTAPIRTTPPSTEAQTISFEQILELVRANGKEEILKNEKFLEMCLRHFGGPKVIASLNTVNVLTPTPISQKPLPVPLSSENGLVTTLQDSTAQVRTTTVATPSPTHQVTTPPSPVIRSTTTRTDSLILPTAPLQAAARQSEPIDVPMLTPQTSLRDTTAAVSTSPDTTTSPDSTTTPQPPTSTLLSEAEPTDATNVEPPLLTPESEMSPPFTATPPSVAADVPTPTPVRIPSEIEKGTAEAVPSTSQGASMPPNAVATPIISENDSAEVQRTPEAITTPQSRPSLPTPLNPTPILTIIRPTPATQPTPAVATPTPSRSSRTTVIARRTCHFSVPTGRGTPFKTSSGAQGTRRQRFMDPFAGLTKPLFIPFKNKHFVLSANPKTGRSSNLDCYL